MDATICAVDLTERIYFWSLSLAALAYVFYLAWQDEFGGASITWSLALLLIIGVAAFSWWRPKDDLARRARPIFFVAAGAFVIYVLIPWLFHWLMRLFPKSSLIWRVPGMDYFAEVLWYAVPLAAAIILFRIVAPKDFRERFFLRFNWQWEDTFILLGLAAATALVMWLYLSFFTPSEGWSALETGRAPLAFILFGIFSSAANALAEEFWYRGYFLGLLTRVLKPWQGIALTAVLFGIIHIHGIPSGMVGVFMAAAYGAVLAIWTWKRGSLWQAVSLHFLTDMVIFFGVN